MTKHLLCTCVTSFVVAFYTICREVETHLRENRIALVDLGFTLPCEDGWNLTISRVRVFTWLLNYVTPSGVRGEFNPGHVWGVLWLLSQVD